jgi:hypothetical protein
MDLLKTVLIFQICPGHEPKSVNAVMGQSRFLRKACNLLWIHGAALPIDSKHGNVWG